MQHLAKLDRFFDDMWNDYCQLNPQARAVWTSLTKFGEDVVNDHVAFRTFSHPKIQLDRLAPIFLKYGFEPKGNYQFKEKKLNAKHFAHPNPEVPLVFISELDTAQCSPFLQQVVNLIVESISADKMENESFLYAGRPWKANYETYRKLALESEYAAWVYAHGFRPNHFTVSINHLKQLWRIEDLNAFLKKEGFTLNSSGGEIKGSPKEYLEQSSTMANLLPVHFEDGVHMIPGCYYEFAKRYPMSDGKIFKGFVGASADKIFESTNRI